MEWSTMWQDLADLARDEDGLSSVEYALLITLVAIGAFIAWRTLGTTVQGTAQQAANQLRGAG
ncbi:MAG: Flp family type IVb pilin [Armatimonadota bacterium]|nr:Flp family type IVb pilin [Armatimonadota bacterium]